MKSQGLNAEPSMRSAACAKGHVVEHQLPIDQNTLLPAGRAPCWAALRLVDVRSSSPGADAAQSGAGGKGRPRRRRSRADQCSWGTRMRKGSPSPATHILLTAPRTSSVRAAKEAECRCFNNMLWFERGLRPDQASLVLRDPALLGILAHPGLLVSTYPSWIGRDTCLRARDRGAARPWNTPAPNSSP